MARSNFSRIPLSRRDFLKLSGTASAGLALSTCGLSQTPWPTLTRSPTSTPIETATPSPTPTISEIEPQLQIAFKGIPLSIQYLEDNGKILQDGMLADDKKYQSQPVLVPTNTSETPSELAPLDFTLKAFRIRSFNYKDPLHILKFAIAQGPKQGTNGAITYFQPGGEKPVFGELALFRERLENPSQVEYRINEGYPQGLVLRHRVGITVIGVGSNGDIAIAFEESLPRGEKDFFDPYIHLAVVSSNEFVTISKNLLPNIVFSKDNPAQIVYPDSLSGVSRTVDINPITDELMQKIYEEAGFFWIDKYPDDSVAGFALFPQPIVKYSKELGIPSSIRSIEKTNLTRKGHVRSKTIHVINDLSSELRWIIEYNAYSKTWAWKTPKWRHIGELIGLDIADITIGSNPYDDQDFQKALAENFSMLSPGCYMEHFFRIWGKSLARSFRESTRRNDQVLQIFPLFWPSNYLDYSLKNASVEEIRIWMVNWVDDIFEFIQPIEPGGRPTHLQIANEFVVWVDPKTGQESKPPTPWVNPITSKTEWGPNPFHRAYGNDVLKEIYLMVYRKAQEKGIQIGKDLFLSYCDFNNHTTRFGSKTRALLRILRKTKEDVAKELGIEPLKVQLNVGIQGHYFYKDRPEYVLPPPTAEELEEAINLFKEIGDVYLMEINIIGASSQQEKVEKLLEVFRVALKTGCISVAFWNGLRSSVPEIDKGDIYNSSPVNLFDSNYQPVKGNGYYDILNLLIDEAINRNLIG